MLSRDKRSSLIRSGLHAVEWDICVHWHVAKYHTLKWKSPTTKFNLRWQYLLEIKVSKKGSVSQPLQLILVMDYTNYKGMQCYSNYNLL